VIEWRLLVEPHGQPGANNMAIDAGLLDDARRTGAAYLRLYRWAPPCLSFGRNEPARARYDRDAIARRGLDTVRRPTGGRAVWHAEEVTYAVEAPVPALGSLRQSYLAIHERLTAALRHLGVSAELAAPRRTPGLSAGACFAAAVGGEIVVGSRKVVGSAQWREGGAFLQHGSILLDGSQDMVQAVSREPMDTDGSTTLRAALGRAASFEEVVDAIVQTWSEPLRPSASPPIPSSTLFSDPAWIWRR
jgi:lipoate-protein ligase A